jgi:NodT family efflux transporter outer membrane factor (OMF) lipoprotein
MVFRVPASCLSGIAAGAVCCAALLTGCAVGPKYTQPPVSVPSAYKESPADASRDWKAAQPDDAASRGAWWERYADPELNSLEEKLNASNYSIAAAAANVQAARAIVQEARAQYYPTITGAPSITQSRLATGFGQMIGRTFTTYSLPFDVSWEPDFWNRIRNTVSADAAAAQASAADLENVRLAAQAELAADYFQLRGQDALKQVLDSVVIANRDSVALVRNQCIAGLSSDDAIAQAEAELHSALAQDANLAIARAQYEHAIAALAGQSASTFSIAEAEWNADPPATPVALPSELLERRPDIASAERAVAQANAQIGVARTAFFPTVLLSAAAGFQGLALTKWLEWPARVWSLGPSVAETLFDGGLRRATVQQAQATYDQTVADYRQSVLTAFQEVEDQLAALKTLAAVIQQQDAAVQASARALELAKIRYEAGLDPYLNVITADVALLTGQQASVGFRVQQMVASVQLIKALGGGWDVSQLPQPAELERRTPRASNNRN